ncbi:uncharacterized protein [Drosophila takahashii]|uniref:uncharacterized protein isoform X2 n=1 Tax=Drosophila takahashii TaxID=29030 RepID=UPI0038993B54
MSELNDQPTISVPTVREVQQMFAELLSHGDDITWDLLSANQGDILRKKINEFRGQKDSFNDIHSEKNEAFFDSIWYFNKFSNGHSLTSLFFVMIVDNVSDAKLAEESRSWYLYPVFRCRRCIENNSGQNKSSVDCCMAYVNQYDTIEGWDNFVKNTRLRPGIMVTPNRGVYKLIDGKVELKTYTIQGRLRTKMLAQDRCISPEKLEEGSRPPNETIVEADYSGLFGNYAMKLAGKMSDRILYQLLVSHGGKGAADPVELSNSLILFTHSVNNFRLASLMTRDHHYRSLLNHRLKSDFGSISEQANRFEEKVDLIRGANEMSILQLDMLLKNKLGKLDNFALTPSSTFQGKIVEQDDIKSEFRDLAETIDNFGNIMAIIGDHLDPEIIKVILKLTQTFVETTRDELFQFLKYYISTETVLYRIILTILMMDPSNREPEKVKEQSSSILETVKAFFLSVNLNSPPELLKKCTKCIGYYHISKNVCTSKKEFKMVAKLSTWQHILDVHSSAK